MEIEGRKCVNSLGNKLTFLSFYYIKLYLIYIHTEQYFLLFPILSCTKNPSEMANRKTIWHLFSYGPCVYCGEIFFPFSSTLFFFVFVFLLFLVIWFFFPVASYLRRIQCVWFLFMGGQFKDDFLQLKDLNVSAWLLQNM